MTESTPSVAILVHACDRYEFLFEGFGFFFRKHWDMTMPCTFYIATEVKDAAIPGFVNIKSGKGEWSDRLKKILTETLREDYVIYLQEDMWFTAAPEKEFFSKLFEFVQAAKVKLVKLHSSEVYKTVPTEHTIGGLRVAIVDNTASQFLMSHQISLWDRKFLAEQLQKGEHPWRNERRGSVRLKQLNPEILQIDAFSENGKPANNRNEDGAMRGEYYSVSVNAMLNERVLPCIVELSAADDTGIVRYAAKLQDHFKRRITHDGLQKPRKQDIFNRIKHWWKK